LNLDSEYVANFNEIISIISEIIRKYSLTNTASALRIKFRKLHTNNF